ncbi:MAG TPA: metallopeptidase TldD-related protein [Bryobacteraceae bacterium]|nr:metallopeptidase TldD-related protein [Bryobacteraceae bacterium]
MRGRAPLSFRSRGWMLGTGLAVAFAAAITVWGQSPNAGKDPLLQAMHDELERSGKLTLNNLEGPYFVEYVIDESENFSVSASLGGLVSRRHERFREPEVHVRVGDYKFDNTNFGGGFGFRGQYDLERFPLENSYPLLRRYLWLETDSAYKGAVEAISRKRAAIRNLQQSDQLSDFAHAEPVHHVRDFQRLSVDEDGWAKRVRTLSGLFSQYPDVKNSSVELEASTGGYTIANTEGTEVREPENVTYLRVRAIAQAADGMTMRDSVTFHALDISRMPGDAEMTRGVTAVAENVVALAHAPRGEDYSGPVLFEGTAGAQILAEVLGKNLALTRRPLSTGGRGGGYVPSELEGRMGARVLPDSFDVVDDPTQKEWQGRPLFGSYDVDREGVVPKPLRLVEKGVLKGYLLTRQPVRGFEGSNGRARLPGNSGASIASFSNLFFSSSDTVPMAELKKKLIDLTQTRGKPYGIIVRKMDFPSSASVDEVRRILTSSQGGDHPISSPLLVYKVYPDGHEELVRGLRFRGFNVRSLKDILAAGNDSAAFEYMDSAAPFALMGASGFTAETCVVAPSILVDDLELHPVEDEQPKLPVVSAPELIRQQQ